MRLKKQEREFFQKRLENFFVKKSTILSDVKWSITSYEKGSLGKRFIML
jgi:hypothetical protein